MSDWVWTREKNVRTASYPPKDIWNGMKANEDGTVSTKVAYTVVGKKPYRTLKRTKLGGWTVAVP